jgi:hypothetical protein
VGLAPVARSICAILLPTTCVSLPSSSWVSPAAVRSLRTRDPKSAAIDWSGSIGLAKTSLPFLTAQGVKPDGLSSVDRRGESWTQNVTIRHP